MSIAIESIYPLSPMQQGMLFHSLYAPESGVYYEQKSLSLKGYLNVGAFESAWQKVVDRYSILRTFFVWENRPTPLQVVLKQVNLPWNHLDFRELSLTEQQQQLSELLQREIEEGFQFSQAPLMKCTLIQLSDDAYQFIWSHHHILMDGWCLPIIFKDVLSFYKAELTGETCYLPTPRPYRDYIAWLNSQDKKAASEFWRQTLHGFSAPTPLVVNKKPFQNQQQDSNYFEVELRLLSEVSRKLQNVAQQHHVTLSTIVQAAWGLLLSRYSGQTDVVFGVTVSGRNASLSGVENMVGLLINTLPLRLVISPEEQLIPMLVKIQQLMLELQHYSYTPLVDIQALTEIPGGIPLFESIVVFENYPVDSSSLNEGGSLQLSKIEGFEQTNYPLTLVAAPGDELLIKISYDTARFEEDTIGRMLGHLHTIFSAIVENPQLAVGEIPLLSEAERHQLLVEWNDTQSEYPTDKCIHQLFESQVDKTPLSVAVVFENEHLTYFELNQRANQLAHHLQTLGVGPEMLVGICVERSVDMIVGLLGILKAGGAYVPLDPNYPQERLSYMLADSGVQVLLTHRSLLESLPSQSKRVVCLDRDWGVIEQYSQENLDAGVGEHNLAYVIYTSGSTGKPKGVSIIHQGVVRLVKETNYANLTSEQVFLQLAPISFDASTFEIWGSLLNGAKLVVMYAHLPTLSEIAGVIEKYKITILWLTAALFHLMVEQQLDKLKSVRQLLAGGDILSPPHVEKVINCLPECQLINGYGPTENTTFTCCYLVIESRMKGTSVPIGRPISNTQIYILDEYLQPVPIGVPGELYIGGDGLAVGYLNRPELTSEKFIPNPFCDAKSERLYKTGDLARHLADGNIEYLGRIDNQVKIRGFRIELGEIEAVLNTHAQIEQAVVIVREDIPGNKRLIAYVVTTEESLIANQLREFLQQKLPEYMVPSAFVTLDTLPLTPNGKIDKKALPAPDGVFREQEYIAPRTPTEEIIANTFAVVLGVQNVGIHDNFFTLGGNSLLATQLISRLRLAFTTEIPLRAVFESPTVTQLDQTITRLRTLERGLSLPPIQPIEGDTELLPLSWAQERLWFLNQFSGSTATYNIPAAVRISGDLDLNALQQALSEIVRRHSILRTSFQTVNGTPIQVIHPEATMNINVVDLQQHPAIERETLLYQLVQTEAITPFSLEIAPLIRCSVLLLSDTEYVLLLSMHHIVSDGWSIGIFIKELSALYQAICVGEPSPLPELAIQYADFAVWQRQWLSGVFLETQLNYWLTQLHEVPSLLQLPTDRPRPVVQTYHGRTHSWTLNTDLTQKLQSLSRESGTTLFMTLLAAFATLLYRYSGESDILVGSPIANRNRSEIESLIGFFVNTLVLRTRFEANPSFKNLLSQVRETTLQAYEHQDLPFEQVVEALQPQRSLAYSPLFQVMFVLQNAPLGEIELPGVTLTQLDPQSTIAKFDLTLSMTETDQGLVGEWEYNTDLYDDQTIERMAGHFHNLLSAIVENPQLAVGEIPLLSEAERHQLLREWNDTESVYPTERCIHQLFESQVEKTPHTVAVVFDNQQLTYLELNQRANQLAHHLLSLGVGPEVLVGICVERSVEMVVGLLGILKAGGAYVPLDPNYPLERLSYMLADSGVLVLLTHSELLSSLPSHSARVVCLDTDWGVISQHTQENLDAGVGEDNLVYVIYTSGSTGKPKGVMNTHQGVHNRLRWMQQSYQLTSSDRVVQKTPFSFDVSVWEFFWPLLTGSKIVVALPEAHKDSTYLVNLISTEQITTIHFVPSMLQVFLLEPNAGNCSCLKRVFCSGEALPFELTQRFFTKLECELHNLYGPTEAAIDVTFWQCLPQENLQIVPIGRPISNTQIYILDKYLQPVSIGVSGELYIGGDGLARGYLNRPELTSEKFISNPLSDAKSERLYKTGDLARYLADGNIEYLGRIDNQVKIRGFRIELGEIEAVLNTHPQIQQAVVIVTEVVSGNKRLVAYVSTSDPSLTTNQQREFLKQHLPEYMVPSAFVTKDTLPLTPNGKIDRKALPAPDGVSREQEYIAPRTPTEEIIANTFAVVLGVQNVGIHDNFFTLGGNSLLATQLISRLRLAFTTEIPLRAVFESPTVTQLDQSIIELRTLERGLSLPPIQPIEADTELLPLSWAQERLWFLNQFSGSTATYNIPAAVRISGDLDLNALQQALSEIVRRHEILRTSFPTVNGTPIQVIHPEATMNINVVDLQQHPAIERETLLYQLLQTEAITPFSLEIAPLIRCSVLLLSDTEYVLLLSMHHIVSDGWSIGIFIKELSALYQAICVGEPSPLPELAIQYADFAVWQRQWLSGVFLETQLNYWLTQLHEVPSLLQLPTDRPRPVVQTYEGRNQSFTVLGDLTQKLQSLSRESGTTLFMTLLAAFATLLYRYSGESDILVGSPIANRNRSEIESLIGFFVNTLVLRTRFEDNPSFKSLLSQVRETTLQAYEHQDVPFEQVVEALQPQRSLAYSPLFQVMFVLQNAPVGEVKLPGVTLSELAHESTIAKFDLTLSMSETDQGLVGSWEYNTDLYDGQTIERMAGHFQNLLSAIAENPQVAVGEIPLLSETERHQLLVEWNDTESEYPTDKCIHQLFESQVQKTPLSVAVVFENQQLTYLELNQRANQLAHHLLSLGVGPEMLVGICVERSVEMVVGLLGILKAGGAYVPLDPNYPQERLSYMLADSGVQVLLTHSELLSSLPSHTARVVCLDTQWNIISEQSEANPVSDTGNRNLAYVIYTSGSTGNPKGVLIPHYNVVRLFAATQSWYNFHEGDIWTFFHSYAFDFSVWEIWGALLYGGRLIIVPYLTSRSPESFYKLLYQEKVTVLNQTPSAFGQLIQVDKSLHEVKDLNLRLVIFGGEALELQSLKPWFEQHGDKSPQLVNMYGITETTVHVTYRPLTMADLSIKGSMIGSPIPDLQVYILDQSLQPTPIGVGGEIHIGGAGLARGYLNRSELTQEKFIPNPFSNSKSEQLYKTGDLARYLADGNIEYLGRIDNQVKIRGFRIELGEIEAVLNTHSQIQQAVVIVTEVVSGNKRLVAYVSTSDKSLTTNQLREFLKQQLPEYMVPSAFVTLDTLPLTPNGKIDKKALPTPDGEITREDEYVAPSTVIEQTLTNIWQELLLKEKVSIHDNFFEIGGDSILSIQVVSRAKNSGIQITPKQIFLYQTIAELASVANTTVSVECQQGIVTGVAPLTPIQHWFNAQNKLEVHHYNQSVLLQIPKRVQSEFIEIALKKLLSHHDALRLRFTLQATEYKQINLSLDDRVPFAVVDLSSTPRGEQPQALEKIATVYQASLNLSSGPIMQVVMFNLGDEDARLLIIIHHLAVDGVSWRIFLSDLERIYQQLIAQKPIELDAKTTAFIDWAKKLNDYAQSEILKQELDYWLNQPWDKKTPLPLDYAHIEQENTVGSAACVSVKLSSEETQSLLLSVNEAYNTQINDILLSALVQALAEWTGNSTVLINLEGHGREELFSDVDLSRTVGWFTSLFPVLLQLPPINQPASVIKSIKEQLRAIPNRGIGYGILRYLCKDSTVNQQIQTIPTSEISFNYLGQFDQIQSVSDWKFAPESTGANQSPKQNRDHLLDINALVVEGELQIDWTYSSHVHTHATVEKLAQRYIQELRSIIEHCQLEEAQGYTLSDFPDAQLNQLELDELLTPLKTQKVESIYPLSPMQQGMLFHSLYAPESGVYYEQMSLSLKGNINVVAFESAWQKVVDRYSILRTFFVWENRQTPLQVVLKQVNLPWNNLDWREISTTEQQQQLSELLQAEREQGFLFNQAPLMGCTLIQLTNDTYNFIWSFHHVLMDGWCLPIIFKDVLSFYEAELTGEICYLPTPRPYRDYIAWLNSQDKKAASEFWRQTLHSFSAPTPLVVNKKQVQNQQQNSNYFEVELRLSAEISHKLQRVAQEHHVTLSTIVQAAWGLLLSRYSGETDVVFGVTVSGRPPSLSGVENMVGLLINTLPLRLVISPQEQLIAWVQQIQQLMLELQDYSYTPLVDIQGLSELRGGTPLFESIVVFENYPVDSSLVKEGGSLQISSCEGFEQTNYPLTLVAAPGNELLIKISYDTVRFEEDTIGRMLGHLHTIFSAIVENPQLAVGEIPLLSEAERHQLLVEWNDTESEYPTDKCIHQLLESQVEKTPHTVAVVFENQQLTYLELNQRANQLAHHLLSLGVGPEVLVGISVERSVEMVVGLLGILKAGGAYVPLDPAYPQERLSYMLADSGVQVLLTQRKWTFQPLEHQVQVICLDSDWHNIALHSQENPTGTNTSENLAYIIYTSGSTGKSKGVMITHQALSRFTQTALSEYEITASDRVLQFASINFDVAAEEIYPCLCTGATLVLRTNEMVADLPTFFQACRLNLLTVLNLPTAYWHQLVADLATADVELPKSLRLVIIGGEKVLPQPVRYWQEYVAKSTNSHPLQLINAYGPTETTVTAALYRIGASTSSPEGEVPIGRPLAYLQAYILDPHLQPVPIDVPGELYIAGDGLARGYLNRPELTSEKFIPNPFSDSKSERLYKTGDLARYMTDGNIEYLGRIDNQVKIRGFRIELGEIEAVLNTHPQIQQVVVITTEDIPGNKRLVAYVVTSDETLTTNQLREFLQQKLPEYMVPSAFVTLDTLPLTPNGKIDKKVLPAPDGVSREQEYIAPRTPTEEIIANTFTLVLGVQNLAIHDNFFTLGGNSLLATQLISRLKVAFTVEIPLRTVFESPTIAQLDQTIAQLRTLDCGLTLPPIQPREGDTELLPLSWSQERLWFLNQLEGSTATYNMPAAVRISGDLDINALQQALSEIVRRHSILRTSFQTVNGTPIQVIHPEATMNINVVHLQQHPAIERETLLYQLVQTEAITPFSLEIAPLIRCSLLLLSEAEYVILLSMHHIVSDGWSIEIFTKELSALYQAVCVGEPSPLPELPIQYADFAVWQRQWLSGVFLETQLNYWLAQLHEVPSLLQLPTDRPRPVVQTYEGRTQSFTVFGDLTQKLQSLSRESGTTLFMTLLAAFATLLYRYSGESDILVGSPIANRNRSEIESLIGFFVNTLVLRTRFEANPSFKNLLSQVRETTLQAYEHQDLPFEQVVEALQPQRSLAYSPLFQVMFVLQNAPLGEIELPGVTLSELAHESTIAKFDLTLSMSETDQGLVGSWEYNTDLYDDQTIERMAGHFQNLLSAIVENPQVAVGEIPLLSEAERHQLLVEWNDTQNEYPTDKCIHQLFESQVEKTPLSVAVVFDNQQLTYLELNQRANQLAHHLLSLGVGPEVLVGICVERSVEMVVGLLGILKAGGAYVPLDPNYPLERLSYMLADSGVLVLLTHSELLSSLPSHSARVVCLDTDWGVISQHTQENLDAGVGEDNLVYVIYTSGSTGKPKGVMNTHQGVHNRLRWMQQSYQLTSSDRVVQKTPFSFDVSVWEFFWPLLTGSKIVVALPEAHKDSTYLVNLISTEQITTIHFVPSMLQVFLLEPNAGNCSCLKRVFCSGEALPFELTQRFFTKLECELHNLYGPTEAAIDVTFWQCLPQENLQIVPIGRPISNTQIYILDKYLQPVSIGVSGELYIGGDGLARGYLNRPELTSEKFIFNPFCDAKSERLYKTGDLARYLADGNIEYLGRIDNQVKIRGFRIELGEIEAVLNTHPQIQQAVVIVTEVVSGNKRLVAYVSTSDPSLTTNQQREFLQQRLPEYMVPNAFVTLDTLPLTPNGKIDTLALPMPDGVSQEQEYIAPRTAIELQLTQIWSSVINITPVGVRDNFFTLGGHSLLAVRLMSQIQQHFQINLPLSTLFQSPTIEQLAHLLSSSTDSLTNSALVPIKSNGNQPPLFFIHPVGGNVICYQHLAYYLSSEQPCYGLQAVGLNPQNQPHTSIEQMATHYIQELQTVQPHGPYFLSGWSLGGLVAFEMAQQLSHQGEQIALLAVLDTYPPSISPKAPEDDAAVLVILLGEDLDLCLEQLRQFEPEEQLIYVVEQGKQKNLVPEDFDLAQARHFLKIHRLNAEAAQNYKPQYYSGSIVLFQASETDSDLESAWHELVEHIETYVVPGNHENMHRPPHVQTLAQKLQKFLDQAQTNRHC